MSGVWGGVFGRRVRGEWGEEGVWVEMWVRVSVIRRRERMMMKGLEMNGFLREKMRNERL